MRVGLLAYGLDRPQSGVTRVARELGNAFAARDDVEVVPLTTYRRGPFADAPSARILRGCARLPALMLLGGAQIGRIARDERLDIVHDPIGIAPFLFSARGSERRVVTLHDAIAFVYPRGYPLLNNLLHRVYIPAMLPAIDRLVTDSNHARGEISRFLRVDARAIPVIPLGVSDHFSPGVEGGEDAPSPSGVDGPYLLFVGAFQARKNIPRLLEAYARVRQEIGSTRLVLVGPRQWAHPELERAAERLGLGSALVRIGYVGEEHLVRLYRGATAAIVPSLYEGFGIPVLEAMASGAPVICSRATSLPEVAGEAALMIDPTSTDDIAAAIKRVCTDAALREDLRARGIARAALFTWRESARRYVDLFRSLLSTQNPQPQLAEREGRHGDHLGDPA